MQSDNIAIAIAHHATGYVMPYSAESKIRHLESELGITHGTDLPANIDGGYPILYLDSENSTICADCANKQVREYRESVASGDNYPWGHFLPVDWFGHYEGPSIYCDDCSIEIESAYGDPDQD